MDEGLVDLESVIRRWCTDTFGAGSDVAPFSFTCWKDLAHLGVLGLDTSEGGGSLVHVARAMEILGALRLPRSSGADLCGNSLAWRTGPRARARGCRDSCGQLWRRVTPWSAIASIHIQVEPIEWQAWICKTTRESTNSDVRRCPESLGRQSNWFVYATRRRPIRHCRGPGSAGVLPAWGAALRMVTEATKLCGQPRQFGVPIGNFQAISHGLADSWARLSAARVQIDDIARALRPSIAPPGHK